MLRRNAEGIYMLGKLHSIVAFVLVVGCVGCKLLSSGSTASEVVFDATPIGAPQGDASKKAIGPEGGTLASPDGRLTLTVPAKAVGETTNFTIQPVANQAANGLGLAYRLGPAAKSFSVPLEVSVHYDDGDLTGTIPEAFMLAYQDDQGAWRAQKLSKLDKEKKILSITTVHFSDWSFISRLRISPTKSSLHKGQSQYIELIACGDPGTLGKLLGRTGKCESVSWSGLEWRVEGTGTIADAGKGVIYTAPNYKPMSKTAYVIAKYEFEQYDETGTAKVNGELGATITILGSAYQATGNDGPTVYSGTICSLEKPFTVLGQNGPVTFTNRFTPSSATAGTFTSSAAYGAVYTGTGPYTVEGIDTDEPRIIAGVSSELKLPGGRATGSGVAHITLLPQDSNDCADDE